MVRGNRELIAGLVRDPQFGPTVMLGVGGILAEAVADVVFRPAPRRRRRRRRDDRRSWRRRQLLGAFRGEAAVDRGAPGRRARRPRPAGDRAARRRQRRRQPADRRRRRACRSPSTRSSSWPTRRGADGAARARPTPTAEQFRALFEPRGVLVAGASTHPGKFGFVSLHNLLASGYAGRGLRHQPGGRGGARRPDRRRRRRPARRRDRPRVRVHAGVGATPTCCGPARPRACAPPSSRRPATARRATRAGGPRPSWWRWPTSSASCSPGPTARASVSTPVRLCAQIVAPYPPAGRIGVASQSGNFVSSFLNMATGRPASASAAPCRPATPPP